MVAGEKSHFRARFSTLDSIFFLRMFEMAFFDGPRKWLTGKLGGVFGNIVFGLGILIFGLLLFGLWLWFGNSHVEACLDQCQLDFPDNDASRRSCENNCVD